MDSKVTGVILALIVTVLVGFLIVKKYKPQPVLVMGGMILMLCAVGFHLGTILPAKESTGAVFFDLFEFIKKTLSTRVAGLGLSIMAVGGFARYMDQIGASKVLVQLAIKPLRKLKAPYVMLSACFLMGQFLGLFINSASGLGMLLMVTMFPVLVSLGVSRLSATAAIATTMCLDWSPTDPGSVLSAEKAGMSIGVYWQEYQVPVALTVMAFVAVLHYLVQRWFDRREGHKVEIIAPAATPADAEKLPPVWFALLPMVPLILILTFTMAIKNIKMDLVNSMLISLFVAMACEFIRSRDLNKVFADIQVFFDGMGMQFAAVVTLVVSGEVFAQGLRSVGAIDSIISSAQNAGFGASGMILVMVGIIAVCSVVMGSGNAPFFAFAALAPVVAAKMSIPPVLMLLPMHFGASIARAVSPITAVIVVTSGIAGVSPFDLVKRTAIPMAGALIVNVAATFLYFYR